ncbi:MAG: signal recognition particle protein [Planctomycetota bacterium]|nr:signal recognition particle protein [Planctomycetota bacterium]
MFEGLTHRLQDVYRNLSGRGRISDANVQEALAEVRTALLEADVEQSVVRDFCDEVLKEALGESVTRSLKPGDAFIGIVHRKLVELMGPTPEGLSLVSPGPTVVLMCGLQGSGKTTTCGKLAHWFRKRGQSVLVAACDLQRPAAVEQLQQVVSSVAAGGGTRVEFYGEPDQCAAYGKAVGVAVSVAMRAHKHARSEQFDVLLVDTAGRLHVDDALMSELEAIDRAVSSHHRLLVIDAMTGQDAVRSAKAFHDRLTVDGVILSKFDSDTRGGAAMSVKRVTGAPLRFVGVGERFDALEEFHAERAAGRILGMGDVVSLVQKAQQEVSEEEAARLNEKMQKGQLTLDDFLSQLRAIRRMGPLKQVLGLLPGVGSALKGIDMDDGRLNRIEAMVCSMNKRERTDLAVLNRSRVKRIATGSGTSESEVNGLVKQFEFMQKMTKQMANLGPSGRANAMRQMAANGAQGGMGSMTKGSTRTESIKSRFKPRKK